MATEEERLREWLEFMVTQDYGDFGDRPGAWGDDARAALGGVSVAEYDPADD